MKTVELLAPAGSFDSLKAAVSAGANAVYLGGIRFGARAFANNFDKEELIEAVKYCHIRGVKVYVTMNTLLYDHEIEDAIDQIKFYYYAQVDALIIQDLGLFEILEAQFPDFEIHCSTQMHIHNVDGVRFARKHGAKRVVLARETPIELVKKCCEEDIEIEVFVHGALCVCYSGRCLMSSYIGNRSGNRGECAQPCRLQYSLIDSSGHQIDTTGEYLLSPKDLYTLDHVNELIDAGVTSFKIEGRMKRPEYVYEVVRQYREAIDKVMLNQVYTQDQENLDSLKKLFNRGFTTGHLFNQKGLDLVNYYRPNHQGIVLGKVIHSTPKGIMIKLINPLHQGDGIRIVSKNYDFGMIANRIAIDEHLVNSAQKNDVIFLETNLKQRFYPNDEVLLTTDSVQCNDITSKLSSFYEPVLIKIKCIAIINQPLIIQVSDGVNQVEVTSEELCQTAQKIAVTKEKIIEQISKIKDTVYEYESIEIVSDDNLFLSLKTINEIRRLAIECLNEKRIQVKRIHNIRTYSIRKNDNLLPSAIIEVDKIDQFENLQNDKIQLFSSRKTVLDKFENCGQVGQLVSESREHLIRQQIIINQLGALETIDFDQSQIIIAGSDLNVTNSYAIQFLMKCGVNGIIASTEMNVEQVEQMIEEYLKKRKRLPQVAMLTYGHRRCMISKYCLLNTVLEDGKKMNCHRCKSDEYKLQNKKGDQFILSSDDRCHSLILEAENFELREISKLILPYIHFTIESDNQVKEWRKRNEKIFK